MSIKYSSESSQDLENFFRVAIETIGGQLHSFDKIETVEHEDEIYLIRASVGDYETWNMIHSSFDVIQNLENNYNDRHVPRILLYKFGHWLIHDIDICEECHEPIIGISYEDVEKTKEYRSESEEQICINCSNIYDSTHTTDHKLILLHDGSFCDYCARDLEDQSYYLCQECTNLYGIYVCDRCHQKDHNKRKDFLAKSSIYPNDSDRITTEELYQMLTNNSKWYKDYNWRPILAKYLNSQPSQQPSRVPPSSAS